MARRKRTWREIIPTLIILGVILVLGIIAASSSNAREAQKQEEAARQQELAAQQKEQAEQEAAEYNNIMTALKLSSHTCSDSASKAVTLKIIPDEAPGGTFTKEYVPNGLIAEIPDEVRYIIRCTANKVKFGEYLGGGIAYQYSYDVQIVDLSNGETIAENSFLGMEPPSSVQAGSGDHCGAPPSSATIQDWVASVLPSA